MIRSNYILVLSLTFCWLETSCEVNNITRCDQLPRVPLILQSVALTSPFHVYRSNIPDDKCTTGVVTGPGPGPDGTQNLTVIFIKNGGLKAVYSVQRGTDQMSSYMTQCGNASDTTHYYSMLFQINATIAVDCVYYCDPSGLALKVFRCYGHTVQDEAVIQQAINQYLTNVPGYKGIFDAQAGCHYSSYCSDYF